MNTSPNNTSQRRAEMLLLLQKAALENSRRLRNRRRALLLAPPLAILAAAGCWWALRGREGSETKVATGENATSVLAPLPAPESLARLPPAAPATLGTEQGGAGATSSLPVLAKGERFSGIHVEFLDDDQLLDLLNEIGLPAALARINGQTELVSLVKPPADKTDTDELVNQ